MSLAFKVALVTNAVQVGNNNKWSDGVRVGLGVGHHGCAVRLIEGKSVEEVIQALREFSPLILILDHELESCDGAMITAALPEDLDLPKERIIGTDATTSQEYCFKSFFDLNLTKDDFVLRKGEGETYDYARFHSVANRLWDGIQACQDEYWKHH